MEQLSGMPPLPTEGDICSRAVRSVVQRGFYDQGLPSVCFWPERTVQFGRLAEEVGEMIEVTFTTDEQRIADEIADVLIVLCQLAWLYGMQPGILLGTTRYKKPAISLSILLGRLWRAMRKNDSENVRGFLLDMADHVNICARIHEIDIEQAMAEKLVKDEKRGLLHGETVTWQ